MSPTLREGDWLLVDPRAYAEVAPRLGELVVAADPRAPERWLVKRVAAVVTDDELHLAGDHPAHADTSDRVAVSRGALIGRPWLRYWPPSRFGRLDVTPS